MQITCPSCARTIPAEDVNIMSGAAKCSGCHAVFLFRDQLDESGRASDEPAGAGRSRASERARVPLPERIAFERESDGVVLKWKWFSIGSIGLLFFAIFWDGFLVFWYSIALSSGKAPSAMLLFPLIHVAVGVGITYRAVCGLVNTTTIQARRDELVIGHAPMPWLGGRKLARSEIDQLYAREMRGNKGAVSYALFAQLTTRKSVKLVGGLRDGEEALYLEQEIERQLGIRDRPIGGELSR